MSSRRIYLVRHGLAEELSATGRDRDRALTAVGREKVRHAARGLARVGVEVDRLVSSPLVRAVQTADEMADEFPAARREVWEELACGVDEIGLTARLDDAAPSQNVMLVGHEPDLGEILAYWLTGRAMGFSTRVRKGSVICLLAAALPPGGRATLEWMMTARQLGLIAD